MNTRVSQPFGVCSVEEDTRLLAELAAAVGGRSALDMGTGTGYVAVYLAQRGFAVDAVDVSLRALQVAQANAAAAGVQVRVYPSNLFEAVTDCYDVIAFNPPMNPNESEVTRWLTSTLRRWNRLARLLMRLGARLGVGRRDRFLADFVREARLRLNENGRLLIVLEPREIQTLAQAVPGAVVHSLHPVPSLPPLQIAVMGFARA